MWSRAHVTRANSLISSHIRDELGEWAHLLIEKTMSRLYDSEMSVHTSMAFWICIIVGFSSQWNGICFSGFGLLWVHKKKSERRSWSYFRMIATHVKADRTLEQTITRFLLFSLIRYFCLPPHQFFSYKISTAAWDVHRLLPVFTFLRQSIIFPRHYDCTRISTFLLC